MVGGNQVGTHAGDSSMVSPYLPVATVMGDHSSMVSKGPCAPNLPVAAVKGNRILSSAIAARPSAADFALSLPADKAHSDYFAAYRPHFFAETAASNFSASSKTASSALAAQALLPMRNAGASGAGPRQEDDKQPTVVLQVPQAHMFTALS